MPFQHISKIGDVELRLLAQDGDPRAILRPAGLQTNR